MTTLEKPARADKASGWQPKHKAASDVNATVDGLKERLERHSELHAEFRAKENELNAHRFELRSFLNSASENADPALAALLASQSASLAAMGGGVDWDGFMRSAAHAAVMLREGF